MDSEEANVAIGEYINLKKKITTERQELTKLQSQILEYMENEEVDRVFGEDGIIAKSLRTTYKYDEQKLRDILEPIDKWEAVLKVDGVALRNILATLPSRIQEEAGEAKAVEKQSVSLSVKKGKLDIEEDLILE